MTDYVEVQLPIRIADNPELDPCADKVWLTSAQSETDGYAREDNLWIVATGDTVDVDFDAFADSDWVDVAAQNEGANQADLTLTDAVGVLYTLPIPPKACILARCYKISKMPGDPPAYLYSASGTRVRLFAWGNPWTGEPQ